LPGPSTPTTPAIPTTPRDPDDVLADVRRIVVEVIGEDYVSELDIERDTAFRADLDVESIELVALGEALRARYGDGIRLAQWIGDMELDEIIAMTVGQLVDHVVASLDAAEAGDA
jgi:acyl carrier protein